MSQYVDLGKMPESPEERRRLIEQRVTMEDYVSHLEITHIQRRVLEFLILQKGYTRENIEVNKEFKVQLGDISFDVMADVVLKVDEKRFLVIKCAANSLDSWERHSVAFCRVVDKYRIPYAVITDGDQARMLDALSGQLLTEGLDTIPSREKAQQIVQEVIFSPLPNDKHEREKRILHAFDAIKCPAIPTGPGQT
ncbi:MAG: type I restriction enzyme HsdR N-terminal domain-containing protein [Dissulfurispiraceae bacterium]